MRARQLALMTPVQPRSSPLSRRIPGAAVFPQRPRRAGTCRPTRRPGSASAARPGASRRGRPAGRPTTLPRRCGKRTVSVWARQCKSQWGCHKVSEDGGTSRHMAPPASAVGWGGCQHPAGVARWHTSATAGAKPGVAGRNGGKVACQGRARPSAGAARTAPRPRYPTAFPGRRKVAASPARPMFHVQDGQDGHPRGSVAGHRGVRA
jgi:hypothetical protein